MNRRTSAIMPKFQTTEEEINKMIESLSKEFDKNEVQKLSKAWIREIMIQPKNSKRRTFEYARGKLEKYLSWRRDCDISKKVDYYLTNSSSHCMMVSSSTTTSTETSTSETKQLSQLASNGLGGLYWYGTDNEGSPILWYHANLSNFGNMNVKDEMEFTSLLMTAAFDVMPQHIYNINFVMILDECKTTDILKRPNLVPAFVRTMMNVCPDRLKRAYVISGSVGQLCYNVAKQVAPPSIMSKVSLSSSRQKVSKILVEDGVLKKDQIPKFMGGMFIHDEQITKNYYHMIETLKDEMHEDTCSTNINSMYHQ